jgi:hypothetical protein
VESVCKAYAELKHISWVADVLCISSDGIVHLIADLTPNPGVYVVLYFTNFIYIP